MSRKVGKQALEGVVGEGKEYDAKLYSSIIVCDLYLMICIYPVIQDFPIALGM